jgi:hypothetical protein
VSKKYVVIPDQHATPKQNNDRARWVGEFIKDTKPDVVVNMGDMADMSSLCSYDKGKKSFQGRTYQADINSHIDFQEKLWQPVKKAKKKLPRRITLIGNHEERIARAIENQSELDGVIGYDDLELREWYDTIVPYNGSTPGAIILDGITFAHYIISGISGRPISGEHHAHSLLTKTHSSCVVAHSHLFDYCQRTRADGTKIKAVVAGCLIDYPMDFAGNACGLWDSGVVVLHNVERGNFDLQWISLNRLKEEYA